MIELMSALLAMMIMIATFYWGLKALRFFLNTLVIIISLCIDLCDKFFYFIFKSKKEKEKEKLEL